MAPLSLYGTITTGGTRGPTRAAVGTNRYLNCRTVAESATALPDTREAQVVRGRLRTSRHAAASTVRLRRTTAIPPAPLPVVRHQKRPRGPHRRAGTTAIQC